MGITNKLFNKSLRILLVTNGSILTAVAMLAPIYAVFVQKIGGDLLDASYAYAAFAVAGGIVTLFSGRLGDKINKKTVVITGYLLIGTGFFGYTRVDSITDLLLVQILIGMGEAIYSPAFDALYSKHLDRGKSSSEWGAWESLNYFSITFGAVAGGLIVKNFGFDAMFLAMSLISYTSALYLIRLPRTAI